MKNFLALVGIVSLLSFYSCGTTQVLVGQEEGWKLLGFEKVNHIREKDVFKLSTTEKFTALRFSLGEKGRY